MTRAWRDPRVAGGVALGAVIGLAAALALMLHRNGHTQGDDFALYLRQARSLFDGNPAQVVADNRFSVVNSGGAFSPNAYPWGLPILLAPFVRMWGLDYDRLKIVIVLCFCLWLLLIHGVVRRRIGPVPGAADRVGRRHRAVAADPHRLVVVGVPPGRGRRGVGLVARPGPHPIVLDHGVDSRPGHRRADDGGGVQHPPRVPGVGVRDRHGPTAASSSAAGDATASSRRPAGRGERC